MSVGNGEIFEDALDGAVLAERAVQRVEGDIGLELEKHGADIAADIHARDAIAFRLERVGTGFSRRKRDRTLSRKPSHQHRNVLRLHALQIPSQRGPTSGFKIESESSGGCPPERKTRPTPRTTQIGKRCWP